MSRYSREEIKRVAEPDDGRPVRIQVRGWEASTKWLTVPRNKVKELIELINSFDE